MYIAKIEKLAGVKDREIDAITWGPVTDIKIAAPLTPGRPSLSRPRGLVRRRLFQQPELMAKRSYH